MNLDDSTYRQPEKDTVRQRVIAHAVNSLTVERASSPVVTAEEFDRTMDYCVRLLHEHCDTDLGEALKFVVEDWHSLHQSRVGSRKPEDLNVLFLAGPDPVPDLMAFKRAGVPFTNIWAIESDKDTFTKAIAVLGREGLPLKVHNGSLQDFFSIVPQQFDIVYFDACAQLFGGKPNTIHVLREVFVNQRLAPLSVLINNFCEPFPKMDPDLPARMTVRNRLRKNQPALAKLANSPDIPDLGIIQGKLTDPTSAEKELLKWGNTIGLWSYANGDNDTWTEHFDKFVEEDVFADILGHYSRFTTQFVIRFAGQLLPWWRVVALPGSRREYFSNETSLTQAMADSRQIAEAWSNPLYPALRHVYFTESFLDPNTTPHQFYFKETLGSGTKLAEAVKISSLIRTFYESQWGDTFFSTRHIRNACNPNLIKVLENFKWFDDHQRLFCDIPMPNLLTDLLTGLYGYPYHANMRKQLRVAYQAKETVMFTDAFVLDQARYLYDQLPTLPFFSETFTVPQQLVLRVCMDAIRRHSHYGCDDLFYGCALAGFGESGFHQWSPPDRESIDPNCPKIEGRDSPSPTGTTAF
jgi:hypothetical protein